MPAKKKSTLTKKTKKPAPKPARAKKGARTTTFDDTDKSTRPSWTAPGMWTFVYETGASRDGKTTKTRVDAPAVFPQATFAALKANGAATWRDDVGDGASGKDIALQRTHTDVIRLMVGEWEETFNSIVASGGGVTVLVAMDSPDRLEVVRMAPGFYRRLIAIDPK